MDDLILGALRQFASVPDLRIAARWQGIYLKSTLGQTQVVLHPRKNITMVTAMGGLGMTLSWGLAQQTVAGWSKSRVDPAHGSPLHQIVIGPHFEVGTR